MARLSRMKTIVCLKWAPTVHPVRLVRPGIQLLRSPTLPTRLINLSVTQRWMKIRKMLRLKELRELTLTLMQWLISARVRTL